MSLDNINDEDFDLYEEIKKMQSSIEKESDLDLYKQISDEFGIDLKDFESQMAESMSKVDLPYSSEDDLNLNYNYVSDSGFDLYSTQDILIDGFGRALVPTGIRFEIPEGFEIQVRSKSGLALKQGLMVLNSPGTVDEGYTGEVQVIIFNTNKEQFKINKGMKIAQAVLSKCYPGRNVNLVKVNKVESKDRGENGFGSTGI
jgi:dUTP pyrophosphatase